MYCRICVDDFLQLPENSDTLNHLKASVNKRKKDAVRIFLYGPKGSGKSALCRHLLNRDHKIGNSIDIMLPFLGSTENIYRNVSESLFKQNEREETDILVMEDIHLLDQVWAEFPFLLQQFKNIVFQNRNLIITSESSMFSLPAEAQETLIQVGFKEFALKELGAESKRIVLDRFAMQYQLILYKDVRDLLIEVFDGNLNEIKEFLYEAKTFVDKKRYRLKLQTLARIMREFYGETECVKDVRERVRKILLERSLIQNDSSNL